MYVRLSTAEHALIHNNFNSPRPNQYSYRTRLTCNNVLYMHELHFPVMMAQKLAKTLGDKNTQK